MDGIIREIIETEWTQFDKVQNRGGRAACQDDWKTFAVMRSSQFQVWTQALLESYRKDLRSAQKEGRNLFWEKYARMMERTAPLSMKPSRTRFRFSVRKSCIFRT